MGKWLKRIAIALGVLGFCLFLAVYFGGRWAVDHYLAREWRAGAGAFRVYGPEFRWSLDLKADSAWYRGPGLDAGVSGLRLSADLFRSLLHFGPSARLDLDSVFVRVRPGPDTAKPRRDSIPFPDFELPLAASVRIGHAIVRDTAADSLAPLADVNGLELRTGGPRAVSLAAASLMARATGGLVHRLRASADWGGRDSLAVSAAWGRGRDSATLDARLAKADLSRFAARARLRAASSVPYARAFGIKAALPRAEAVALDAELARGRELSARIGLEARAEGLPRDLPIRLPDQSIVFRFAFAGRAGEWTLRSRGQGGAAVDAEGGIAVSPGPGDDSDSPAGAAWPARNAQVTLKGLVRGFRVAVGGKELPADLDVEEARLSPEAVKAALRTGDGSRLEIDLRRTAPGREAAARASGARPGSGRAAAARTRNTQGTPRAVRRAGPPALPPWNGTFSLDLAPRETWVSAFTDTNVAYSRARLSGELKDGGARAVLAAGGLRAYGLIADSLRLSLRYAGGIYALEPSRWWRGGIAWDLSGRAEPGKAGPPVSLRLANPEFGSLEARQAGPGKLEAHARGLAPNRLPYRGLERLDDFAPRITADFAWDRNAKAGSASIDAEGRYRKEPAALALEAAWDAERLDLRSARASLSANAVTASARVKLRDRQFYELKGVVPADVEAASLRADRFDLAKALAAFLPQPPLRSGRIDGELGFAAEGGFRGSWRLTDLALAGEERAFAIKEVSLSGRGDTAFLSGVTVSETEPMFRDSAAVAISGLLGKSQSLSVRVRAGGGIELAFDGGLTGLRDLRGRLTVRGGAALPGNSGALSDVLVAADLALPLEGGIKGLELAADTLRATYAVAGLDTQAIAATARMSGGKIEVPRLTLTGHDGAELRGRLEFDPDTRRLNADLSGARFSAQFGGDKIQLRELAARVQADSTQFTVQAAVGSGSAEHVKAALRVAGDFSRVTAFYRAPLGGQAGRLGGAIPLIRLSATLDSSNVRYRMRSLETLTGMFRKRGQRRAVARRAKPMQVDINVETAGRGNSVETDVLRLAYVGNLSMIGTYPYALMRGRVTSVSGGIGTKKQAYDIKSMEIKWLNAPMEEGELDLNAEKRLARTCDPGALDSCAIRMNLTGPLSEIKFAYDSDCRGAYGSGSADVSALLFSVRRGCYSPSAGSGAGGLTYQEQALGLLDPLASNYLSEGLGFISGSWIQSAQVTGFGALAQDRKDSSAREAIGVEILSKAFWRVRLRAKSAYNLQYADQFNPWSYKVGVEWRPPVFLLVEDPVWKNRVKNRITVDASVYTDPSHSDQSGNEDQLRRRLGLNYDYEWWGRWWGKRAATDSARAPGPADPRPAAPGSAAAPEASR